MLDCWMTQYWTVLWNVNNKCEFGNENSIEKKERNLIVVKQVDHVGVHRVFVLLMIDLKYACLLDDTILDRSVKYLLDCWCECRDIMSEKGLISLFLSIIFKEMNLFNCLCAHGEKYNLHYWCLQDTYVIYPSLFVNTFSWFCANRIMSWFMV